MLRISFSYLFFTNFLEMVIQSHSIASKLITIPLAVTEGVLLLEPGYTHNAVKHKHFSNNFLLDKV